MVVSVLKRAMLLAAYHVQPHIGLMLTVSATMITASSSQSLIDVSSFQNL